MTRFEERRAPVDIFFRTLADSHGPRAVSVVLSGTGRRVDGHQTRQGAGGICLVAGPGEASTRHAAQLDRDDARRPCGAGGADAGRNIATATASIGSSCRSTGRAAAEEHVLRDVFMQLRSRTGHDFSNYKRATVLRRIARRMGTISWPVPSLDAYAPSSAIIPRSRRRCSRDLLISVTNFFRDPEASMPSSGTSSRRCSRKSTRRPGARLGSGLRDWRGSVLDRDAAGRTLRGHAGPRQRCRSSPPISTKRPSRWRATACTP